LQQGLDRFELGLEVYEVAQLFDYGGDVALVQVEFADLGVRLVEFVVLFPQVVYLLDFLFGLHHAFAGLFDCLLRCVDILYLVLYGCAGLGIELSLALFVLPQHIVEFLWIYVAFIGKDGFDDPIRLLFDGGHIFEIDEHRKSEVIVYNQMTNFL
jgi:hypothetical protein